MRKAVLCFVPTIATLILFACDNTSSSGGGQQFTFDGGQFDGFVPPTSQPDAAAPDVDAGPLPVTVKVNRFTGPIPDVVVVWHDAAGAVIGTTKTDAQGVAVSSGPTPAMASALLGSPTTGPHILTWTGIAGGDVLLANDTDYTGVTTGVYGVTLNQTTIAGSTSYRVRTGNCINNNVDVTAAYDIMLNGACAATPGAVLAASFDDANAVNGFSFAKNLVPVYDAGTVNVTPGAWAAPTDVTFTIANLPDGGGSPAPIFTEIAGAVAFPYVGAPGFDTNGAGTYKVASGFADALQYGITVSDANLGGYYARRVVGKRSAPAAAVSVDYKDLLPILTTGDVDTTDAKRPKVTWTSASTLAGTDGGSINLVWSTGGDFASAWTIIVPPTATSVQAPALPADATGWAPPAVDGGNTSPVQPPLVIFAEAEALPDYASFRAVAGIAMPPPNAPLDQLGDAVLPANGKLRFTSVQNLPQ